MARRRQLSIPVRSGMDWMTTFGDLMSLLLTFFVMLISMATFEPAKYRVAAESLQGAFGVLQSFPTVPIHPFVAVPKQAHGESRRKKSLHDARQIEEKITAKGLQGAIQVEITEKGIGLLLREPATFASGSADLQGQGASILTDIAQILKGTPDLKVRVEGHTDDVPISTARYRSNWELSSGRALSVVQLLSQQSGIPPAHMSATGYGEFRPAVPNTSDENRAQNRRIQIYIDYLESPQGNQR